jgi:diguanylate cyclase (GGDEF)-like protein
MDTLNKACEWLFGAQRQLRHRTRWGRWLYALAVLPMLTDYLEAGRLPLAPREWTTEVVLGVLLLIVMHVVRRQFNQTFELTRRDDLTGLWNRRAFEAAIEDECARARRSHQPLSLAYIDLDKFKQINDRLGHEAGDEVLRQVASAIGQVVRGRIDRGFRLGGDEFALLLPASSALEAGAVVQRIRDQCRHASHSWETGDVGMSAGVIEFTAPESGTEFVQRADAAMYRQKQLHHMQPARPRQRDAN